MTTFGFELAVDATLASTILNVHPGLGEINAGYIASLYGFLNVFTRPLGGYVADRLYAKFGIKAKKYCCLTLGALQGVFTIGFGKYLQSSPAPGIAPIVVFIVFLAVTSEMANGATFSLIPHCNCSHNGTMWVFFQSTIDR